MHRVNLIGTFIVLALTAAALAVHASVPSTIAFQGYLTDAGGAPANGSVGLVLQIYDVPSGGTSLWSETQSSVPVVNGVFAVALGAVTPFPSGLFEAAPRYLGIRVNGEAEMPRTELRSAPFALGALAAQMADSVTGAIDLRRGDQTVLETVNSTSGVRLEFSRVDGHFPTTYVGTRLGHGILVLYEDTGGATLRFLLDAGATGNGAANLPANAISNSELEDEPGVASSKDTAIYDVTSATPQSMISRTITPPTDGYVLALGQAAVRILHTQGTFTEGAIGLSDDGVNFGSAQDVNLQITSNAASGNYSFPAHMNATFAAAEGTPLTIHIVAQETGGNIRLEDLSLTLLFVPTAYGTVDPARPAPGGDQDEVSRPPQSPSDIQAEQEESRRWNSDRIEREIAKIRAEMDELQRKLSDR